MRPLKGIATAVAALTLAGCVSAAPDDSSFEEKTSTTAAAAASEVATVRLTTQLLIEGHLQQNYAEVTISASEDALSSIAQTFSVVQPPDGAADQLRAQVEAILSDASDAVAEARIASRRDDHAAMTTALVNLDRANAQLQAAEEMLG
ncbi:MAG: hypothetical protein LH645_00945 [Actinomycetia bacterium]|nr:hypothetical protein [Actinomycetes bacterium]